MAGFLLLSWDQEPKHGLAFLVGESLPVPGTAIGLRIDSADPVELSIDSGDLEVTGEALAGAGSMVIVRDGRGVRLPISVRTETTASAGLPGVYVGWATDLAVGVLTVDASALSNLLPVTSTVAEATIDYTDSLPPGGALITNVRGPLVWSTGAQPAEQKIEIEGIGIGVGTEFVLSSAHRAPQRVVAETDPPAQHPTVPPSTIVGIKVPSPFHAPCLELS